MNKAATRNNSRGYRINCPAALSICVLCGTCILPGLWIDFYNTTGYCATVALSTTTSSGGGASAFQIDPGDTTDFRLRTEGECRWTVHLVENGREIFVDSGIVYVRNIEGKRPSCQIREEQADSFRVIWDVE